MPGSSDRADETENEAHFRRSDQTVMVWKIFSAFLLLMSLIAFILYGADKHKAKSQQWRVKEKTLLLCGVFGGAAGALIGMKVFHHKTRHWYFWAVNLTAVLLYAAGLALLIIYEIKI